LEEIEKDIREYDMEIFTLDEPIIPFSLGSVIKNIIPKEKSPFFLERINVTKRNETCYMILKG
jgi:hypothetical protein